MSVLTPPIQEVIAVNQTYVRAKRVLDILFTLLIFPILCLVMALLAVLIRIDSPGPVFFRQKRLGQGGVEFEMFKFRSMHINVDDGIHREAVKNYMNGSTVDNQNKGDNPYKLANDTRVTRIGHIIRKTSLDELPQFINVLRGEMSLVGPRPPIPYELEHYSGHDLLRLCGKPGLTGTWQVYGRSRVPFQEMVEMDIAYLQQQSIWQDLKLIILTAPVMLFGRGGA